MISKEKILAYALENAISHEGKARIDAVIPKLFQEGLKKEEIGKIMPLVKDAVNSVNALPLGEQKKQFLPLQELVKKHEHKEEGLPELEGIKGKVITRLAPEPSKYNHIGHALVFLIQYFYAKKYDGECILRIEDTNPEKSTKEYYDAMKYDLSWLGIKWNKEIVASNDMKTFYKYAEQLIKQGNAYTCSCEQEKIKKLRKEMKGCEHRDQDIKKSLGEWNNILKGKYKEGEIILRLKGNMNSNNGVMRDPIIFRISYAKHFIQGSKYHVWPMYDFENPIEDSTGKITHVIRSKEFELRAELQNYILKLLKLKGPVVREIGRYQITGAETQGRVIRQMIERKERIGWDDPRLVTIKALRRRGFVPEMFHELAQIVGLSKASGHVDFKVLASINRKILDLKANRYFFIADKDKVKIKIEKAPDMNAEAPLHPEDKERGVRKFKTKQEFYLSKQDLQEIKKTKQKYVRLMHLFNFEVKGSKFIYHSHEMDQKLNAKLIHWLPADSENIKKLYNIEILMDDASILKGLTEENVKNLKVDDIIQFERFAFCRLDSTGKILKFWFSHK
ncbi:glutamate--tRNA ligase [Candidatus Pacearchaeota archaeon]|nr:glutamate--tRNA ligase [Candidatus Pacearchaeota archaeon]